MEICRDMLAALLFKSYPTDWVFLKSPHQGHHQALSELAGEEEWQENLGWSLE